VAVKCQLAREVGTADGATVAGRDGRKRCRPAVVVPGLVDDVQLSREGTKQPAARVHCRNLELALDTDLVQANDDVILDPPGSGLHSTPKRPTPAHQAELIVGDRLYSSSVTPHVTPLSIGFSSGPPLRQRHGHNLSCVRRECTLTRPNVCAVPGAEDVPPFQRRVVQRYDPTARIRPSLLEEPQTGVIPCL